VTLKKSHLVSRLCLRKCWPVFLCWPLLIIYTWASLGPLHKKSVLFDMPAYVLISHAMALVPFIVLSIVKKRFIRRVRQCDGRLCLNCGYDLVEHGETGVCPECGCDYDRRAAMNMLPPN